MSIVVGRETRVVVQGITGNEGAFWTNHMIEMGTQVLAGVTPGKERQAVHGVPVYHSVARAVRDHEVNTAMLFVPPRFTRDAIEESLAAGITTIVTIADGIPLHDQVAIRAAARAHGARVIGGNTSGIISPGVSMVGLFPYWIERVYRPGRIGVMTRSGSLTNEVTAMVVREGFGVSTLIGVGGDPVPGTRFAEFLDDYEQDAGTDAVVVVGELGGTMEEEVAEAIASGRFTKPLVAFIGGRTAPPGKKMGHAGAIVTGSAGTVAAKVAALEAVGARVADRPSRVGTLLTEAIAGAGAAASAGAQR